MDDERTNRVDGFLVLLILAVCLSLYFVGCASAPVQPIQSTPNNNMSVGINGFYHADPLPPEVVSDLCALGPITIRAAVRNAGDAQYMVDQSKSCQNLHFILLVEDLNTYVVEDIIPVIFDYQIAIRGIELGNEPDLAGLTPQEFGMLVRNKSGLLRNAGYKGDIISGGISSHVPFSNGLDYLQHAKVYFNNSIICGVHTYQEHYTEWMGNLQSICNTFAITEFGKPSTNMAEDQAQSDYLTRGFSYFRKTQGLKYAIIYQLLSCPDETGICNYGLYRADWSKKVGWEVLQREEK